MTYVNGSGLHLTLERKAEVSTAQPAAVCDGSRVWHD